jgi:hypothetical protein
MKNFLAIYLGTAESMKKSGWESMTEADRQEKTRTGMRAWHEWMDRNKESIVEAGGPLGKTKRASMQGVSDTKNNMTGYVVVRAESHDAAARLFEKHPHFAIFPGDSVEVMECLPIPQM